MDTGINMQKYFVQIDDLVREATPEEAAEIEARQTDENAEKDLK